MTGNLGERMKVAKYVINGLKFPNAPHILREQTLPELQELPLLQEYHPKEEERKRGHAQYMYSPANVKM